MSMTWTTSTSLSLLLTIFLIHARSPVTSTGFPHCKPFSFQEVSYVGMPDLNSGAATHVDLRGSVM